MKCAFISDLHVKTEGDEAASVLRKFLLHSKVKECDRVYFLGDIFDFMIGEHKGYIKEYPTFFDEILNLTESGPSVYFIEGNHDFHFEKTIRKHLSKKSEHHKNFYYYREGFYEDFGDKKYFVCHGYEIDYFNDYFKRWYNIYTSKYFNWFVSYTPFVILKKLAEWASRDSKRRGKKTFNFDKMKEKYLIGAKELIKEKQVAGIIGGHTHIPEFHEYKDKTTYYNVGFPARDKHFLYFDGEKFEKIDL